MQLDCVRARSGDMVIVDTQAGGEVARSDRDDSGFAWMAAAHKLAEAITEISGVCGRERLAGNDTESMREIARTIDGLTE